MKRTKILVFVGLLISMEIILTRFLSFQTPIVRVSFGFVPVAFSAIMFGPVIGGITAMLADITGMMIFPRGGPYFPGFTFSALLSGVVYGLFLYKRHVTILRTTLAVLVIVLFIDMGLNTLWLSMITGKAAVALLPVRLTKSVAMLPVQIASIYTLWRYAGEYIRAHLLQDTKLI